MDKIKKVNHGVYQLDINFFYKFIFSIIEGSGMPDCFGNLSNDIDLEKPGEFSAQNKQEAEEKIDEYLEKLKHHIKPYIEKRAECLECSHFDRCWKLSVYNMLVGDDFYKLIRKVLYEN